MNKKVLLVGLFTISIFGMARAGNPDLNSIIGTVVGVNYTDDSSTMTFSVDYGSAGSITGRAQCSSQSGTPAWEGDATISSTLPDSTGQYCYCTVDGYTPVGGSVQSMSGPWVFRNVYDDADDNAAYCAGYCAYDCAGTLRFDNARTLAFRAAVFGSLLSSTISCELGYYLPVGATECALCPTNSYCAGGEYEKSETADSGIAPCETGLIAPSGMWQAEQCGRALHIGDATLYLRQTKQTEHALHIQSGDNIFYGNATTADVPMNINTTHRLKVLYNDVIYSIYDDTIKLDN